MNSILYAANIGTLAAWLGFTSASTVGILVPSHPQKLPELKKIELPDIILTDGEFMDIDMVAGGSSQASEVDVEDNQEQNFAPEAATPEVAEIAPEVPDVPEMPEMLEEEPLPEIPELPEEKPQPKPSQDTFAITKKKTEAPKASVKRATTTTRGSDSPVAKRTQSGTGTGSGSANNSGAGSGERGSGRVSGGRTPRPPYPASARKQGIEGTVRVSVTFGEGGEVLSCSIISASHPALNDSSILSTIRKWKVPGRRGSATLPIRFTLR